MHESLRETSDAVGAAMAEEAARRRVMKENCMLAVIGGCLILGGKRKQEMLDLRVVKMLWCCGVVTVLLSLSVLQSI